MNAWIEEHREVILLLLYLLGTTGYYILTRIREGRLSDEKARELRDAREIIELSVKAALQSRIEHGLLSRLHASRFLRSMKQSMVWFQDPAFEPIEYQEKESATPREVKDHLDKVIDHLLLQPSHVANSHTTEIPMSSTIVVCKPKLMLPTAFLTHVANDHKTVLNIAIADGEGSISFATLPKDGKFPWNEKSLQGLRSVAPEDAYCVLHFGTYKDKLQESDIQPFPIITEGDNVLVAAVVSGEFSQYQKAGHTPEYNFINDFLREQLQDLYQTDASKSVEETLKIAESPDFKRLINDHLAPTGVVILIPNKGAPVNLTKDMVTIYGEYYDWGYTTNKHGYQEKEEAPVVTTPVKRKLTLEEKLALKEKEATKVEEKPAENKPSVPVITPGKTDTKVPDTVDPRTIKVYKAPPGQKENNRKTWVHQNIRKESPRFLPKDGAWTKDSFTYQASDFKADAPHMKGLNTLRTFDELPPELKEAAKIKDTGLPILPMVNPTVKEHMGKLIKDNTLCMSLAVFDELEKEFPSISEELVIDENVPYFYTYSMYQKIAQHNVFAAALFMEQMRRQYLKDHPEIKERFMNLLLTTDKKEEEVVQPPQKLTLEQKLALKEKAAA